MRIVDRKKELIINAAGKNMSPANIESALKSASPLIGQACVIGDSRPYNTALIVLDVEYALAWADELGLGDRSIPQLAAHERVRAAVQDGVDRANATLSRVEQIKRFADPPGRLAAGRRRADADHEAQAQADRDQVRGRRSTRSTTAADRYQVARGPTAGKAAPSVKTGGSSSTAAPRSNV